jgi:hypothetical protein
MWSSWSRALVVVSLGCAVLGCELESVLIEEYVSLVCVIDLTDLIESSISPDWSFKDFGLRLIDPLSACIQLSTEWKLDCDSCTPLCFVSALLCLSCYCCTSFSSPPPHVRVVVVV